MTYQPSRRAPEVILAFGDAGVGKTHLILSVAKRLPNVKFRVAEIDWNPSIEALLQMDMFKGVTNVEARHAYPDEWKDQLALSEWLRDETQPGEWASFDSITHSWSAVQEWFIERMFGEADAVDYFLNQREAGSKKAGDLDGWLDWPYIKKEHTRLYKNLARIRGHVILTAEQAPMGESEKQDDRQMFGQLGFKPAGRKQLAHIPMTVMHIKSDRTGSRFATTLKDRGRELVTGAQMNDFFRDYLLAVAGWTRINKDSEGGDRGE